MAISTEVKEEDEVGKSEYLWAKKHMPVLDRLTRRFVSKKSLQNFRLGICLHITKETSVLLMALKEAGAEVNLCPANPLSIQDPVKSFLIKNDIKIFSKKDDTLLDFYSNMEGVLDTKPNIITDDGGELHKRALCRKFNVMGGTEETTSGVNRLMAWGKEGLLMYPIIAVNRSRTKYLFDNRYGTGQSTIEGILKTTGILLSSKRIVICGYGWVGKGVAKCANGMGAKVTITEVNPLKALEAYFDGFEVKPLDEVISNGDIFITCTGQVNVIGQDQFEKINEGAILCNAGHFDVEIDINYLNSIDQNHFSPRMNIECYRVGEKKKKIYLLAKGRVINLVGAEGNSPEVMSISFANQFLSIVYLSQFHEKLDNQIYNTPKKIERKIILAAMDSFGLKIDRLTPQQNDYFKK
ncbi:Adenosylhomocysteinase [Candidatus Nitrosocosmicus oleophilus]|jgi:adenosylhomocysteinase|uniref:Adenosylhomocysteinase n=1 Tax=Candidatus Nitrosocosmicus oleophilus TaxID=1353260 RepID=A0A654MCE4_9ARCH|nr:adenosylhomocysteinase [Candidatus Nitrosocosmicus oleophilus]ALI37142.1 Adenosylhomocysteinase [Candidatus Nitrosocosmicus oleophilus]